MEIIIIALSFIAPPLSNAEEISHAKVGARKGVTAIKHDERFDLYELFWIAGLPWNAKWPSGWVLTTGLNINAGILRAAHDNGFIGSVGPILTFKKAKSRFSLILGFRLALLDDYEFGDEQLGGAFAFIEEVGLSYSLGWNLEAGYQFRHMSNADIYDHNPGLDLHVFELKYTF
ncbi:MAG: acyloxyacyl hydrolase [Deltaproteobacteria bacterium]|nr:acyloxyacyl hydrolase [Deltaproteobacteria bacterium]